MQALKLKIPPPVVLLICGTGAWLTSCYLPTGTIYAQAFGLLALPVLVCSLGLIFPALILFIRARTTVHPSKPGNSSHLVTSGVYRFSRNPMYLAMMLALLAWILWLSNLFGGIWPVVFVTYITYFQIVPEENVLTAKFGEEYKQYCRKVRRWL